MEEFPYGPYPPRVALALCTNPNQSSIGQRLSDFHTVGGSIDLGEHRFLSQGVGIVEMRRDLRSGVLSSPGRGGSTRSSQSAIG